jgi:DNA-binding HxlR family transcriptional regulator
MSSSSLISNIQFETALLDVFANSNRQDKKEGYWNGVPLQVNLVFKVICCLPDEGVDTQFVKDTFQLFYKKTMTQTSISRTADALEQSGLIENWDNPHGSQRFRWIKLTALGRKLQKLYVGTTSDWKDKPVSEIQTQLKTAKNGRSE